MNDFLLQIALLARNDDDIAGWMQMLVFAILAVFYVLGSILKARANKAKEDEELTGKPARKVTKGAKGLQEKPFRSIHPTHPKLYRKPHLQAQPSRKTAMPAQPIKKEPIAKLKPIIQPAIKPELKELPRFTEGLDKKMGIKELLTSSESPQVKPIGEPLLDYSDPESIRKAILHYEIFGKPLALRSPEEHIIGL